MRTLARRLDQPPDLCRLEPERVTMTDMEETTDVSHVFSGTLQSGASTVVVAVKCLHVTDDVRRVSTSAGRPSLRCLVYSLHTTQSFATEAIVWRHVSHPNVVPFIGVVFGWSDFPLALVSEWMSNATVRGYLQDHPEQQPQPFVCRSPLSRRPAHPYGARSCLTLFAASLTCIPSTSRTGT
jgi:hypothetical protein